jgi:coenzyme F420-reducing hydrogenase delta subunit
MGIATDRIKFSWVSAAEGAKWADIVNATVASIREIGPYTEYRKVAKHPEMEVNHG